MNPWRRTWGALLCGAMVWCWGSAWAAGSGVSQAREVAPPPGDRGELLYELPGASSNPPPSSRAGASAPGGESLTRRPSPSGAVVLPASPAVRPAAPNAPNASTASTTPTVQSKPDAAGRASSVRAERAPVAAVRGKASETARRAQPGRAGAVAHAAPRRISRERDVSRETAMPRAQARSTGSTRRSDLAGTPTAGRTRGTRGEIPVKPATRSAPVAAAKSASKRPAPSIKPSPQQAVSAPREKGARPSSSSVRSRGAVRGQTAGAAAVKPDARPPASQAARSRPARDGQLKAPARKPSAKPVPPKSAPPAKPVRARTPVSERPVPSPRKANRTPSR